MNSLFRSPLYKVERGVERSDDGVSKISSDTKNMKTRVIHLFFFLLFTTNSFAQTGELKLFPLSSVKILDGPFKQAQQTDKEYILALDPDKLLAPYLREAGLKPLAESYGNWENTGLDGHIGGHYLSALSNMYAATGDKEILRRINYMVNWLARCQQANGDGYIGGVPGGKTIWKEIAEGNIKADAFSLNGKWVPLYNIHKTYAGLIDAYRIAGNRQAKQVLTAYADWAYRLTSKLSDTQIQNMLRSEHGGMNEAFADIADITGDKKYLGLAQRFSHKKILSPLLHKQDSLTGIHANTQIPKVIGFMRVAGMAHDTAWAGAADFFWNTVVKHRTISIGGNSVREHFNPPDDFSSMLEDREGPETCNSYNMLKLSKLLFLSKHSAGYMDYYERTLYNHILSSQSPEGGFVYFTPIRPGHYKVYSSPQQSFWCCVGSGLENHGKYGELIYAHDDKDLYVNLFMASTLDWKEKGLILSQNTAFPYSERSTIKLTLKKAENFAIHLRYPAWITPGTMKVLVNNKEQVITKDASAYISLKRNWKTGDEITLKLPMHNVAETLPDNSQWVSFVHGPIVLAAATDTTNLTGLHADDSRMGHIAAGPLMPMDEAPLLVSNQKNLAAELKTVNNNELTFSAAAITDQQKYKGLKLVPFYTLYNTRYVIYWPYTSPEGLAGRQKAVKEKEIAALKLDQITADRVTPGEQQPESDHSFKGEKTNAGIFKDRHFRNAEGWFSYAMRNTGNYARKLQVTYYGAEAGKAFAIYVNNKLLATVKPAGTQGAQFFTVDYELPAELTKENLLVVKFVAQVGSSTANIYEVRLLKE